MRGLLCSVKLPVEIKARRGTARVAFSSGCIAGQMRVAYADIGIMPTISAPAFYLVMMVVILAQPLQAANCALVSGDQVQPTVERLQSWYDAQKGPWETSGWWNLANALTALVGDSRVSHTEEYLAAIVRTYAANIHSEFLSQYYDDEGWWALAWIDASDLTHNPAYLTTATAIFEHDHLISDGLSPECKDNHGPKWSYNQRVILGGLTELSRASHAPDRSRGLAWSVHPGRSMP